ncbi:MAG: 3-hydroxyacyl-ACP dehydratase FabZ [Alphaproteobacteria bacterium]
MTQTNVIAMNDSKAPSDLTLDVEDIKRLIPHRPPMLLIDRLQEIVPGESAVGIKNVTINEPFFPGHFPERPVMPGVLIVEALAQTAGALVMHTLNHEDAKKLVYFMSIENARFRRPVTPGDSIRLCVEKVQQRSNVWKFGGKAVVDGKVYAEATFTAMISDQ